MHIICSFATDMQHILNNPIYNGLLTGNSHLAQGSGVVKYFPKEISPFAGLEKLDEPSFSQLAAMLPYERVVACITAAVPAISPEWKILKQEVILQMTGEHVLQPNAHTSGIMPLNNTHVPQMLALTKLTNPGPFLERTIEFGHYQGLFDGPQLVAMAGYRLHAGHFVEISAVCTHPHYLGKGYAAGLMLYLAQTIMAKGNTPFLHVRADNERAIGLYKNIGFAIRSEMNLNIIENGRNTL